MNKLIFSILFFVAINVQGQFEEPLIGKEFSTAKKENFSGFIGENTTTLYTADYLYINRKKQELNIRKFHKADLQLIDTRNIYQDVMEDYYSEPIEIFFQEGRFFLFSNYFNDREKTKLLSLEIFDEQLEKISFAIIDSMDIDETMEIQESKEKIGFVLISYSKFSALTEQEIHLKTLDKNGEIEYDKVIKSPLALQNLNIEKIRFTNESPIYLLCNYSYFNANQPFGDDDDLINNKYAIWAYDKELHYLKEFEIRIQNKWVNGVKMEIDKSGRLILSGFINESRHHTVNGVFSLLIDKFEVKKSSFEIFDESILNKFIPEKDRDKVKEMPDYKINDLNIMEDGSYFVTGEQYYKYIERNYDPRTNITTSTEHFNYNSIIVSYFDKDGIHQWTDCVPKVQNSTNDFGYYSSYSVMNSGEKLYLFFNDSQKNNELAKNDYFNYTSLYNNRKFQVTFVEVDKDSIVQRNSLISEGNSFMLRAKSSSQINKENMYLLGETGRQAKIFSIKLKG